MKIATWNVNSIRARQQQVRDWLQENPVDVLCLQETKVVDQDFPRAPFEQLGYHLYVSGQKAYNGVAILSRTPVKEVSTGFSPIVGDTQARDFDQQKRVICGTVGEVCIVNLYVPNGSSVGSDKYDYKLRWLKVLREYLQILKAKSPGAMCVCGDFNVAPENRDIHDPSDKESHIMASPAEREALQEVLAIGLADTFRKFTSEGGHYSWWDYRTRAFRGNRGWRIDHHYLTPDLYERATNCKIDILPRKLPKPSDHTPVIVEF
ncbi:MAG: exodeoxyribonuclease III [Cyanobacteria bacterium QH_8_48_120]|jgi:exodeoxyribonuclease-3|nr:MAG: exodeoxyribonuclease III [Cyanobacteria bacterium QH_1_48_107]PSO58199.1 MAG: exodeoxyribonuclease III [Cyanobacteria bacterium QH_10_48_56]PSO62145.1 MAG: exodeoxyribonuclease III [Cyanobacteria bacterium QH_7_48_89]PSO63603.1 MAG: exodeoxyribonuclease III [Cyanobacteria bacterium QH_6_48_35]PSO70392.1 MAG: exodeoxyribonuclease III [Cyanobacteria bacterium QS_1_48_34]PSO70969.1 MAG: exodeoxyribonuclease III [Cyanobacteria bacterium QH_3_48_40]PSO75511.1 MAG: exodeoxyribonuclease III 